MSADTYQVISIIAFSLAAVFFILAVILFIKFNIPGLINDLSGRTAIKQIQEIRRQNIMDNKRKRTPDVYQTSNTPSAKAGVSDIRKFESKLSNIYSWQYRRQACDMQGYKNESIKKGGNTTAVIGKEQTKTDISYQNQESTELLNHDSGTEILISNQNEGTMAFSYNGETEVLAQNDNGGTEVLAQNDAKEEGRMYGVTEELTDYNEEQIEPVEFNIVRSIIIVHFDVKAL